VVAYPKKNVLVVTHGAVMGTLLIHLGFINPDDILPGWITNTAYIILDSDGVDFFVKETYGIMHSNSSS